jgi:hypothetical protein
VSCHVILSETKDHALADAGKLHGSFAANRAAQDEKRLQSA